MTHALDDYSSGEALVETIVKTATNYNVGNVSRGKWGVLNTGKSATYAILKPGGSVRVYEQSYTNHITIIEVWQRYTTDGDTLTALEGNTAQIIAKLDGSPTLGDTKDEIIDSNVRDWSEVKDMWRKGGGPAWLRQDINFIWIEQHNVR